MIDSFLKEKLYDEIILFCADKLIGGKESVELLLNELESVEFDEDLAAYYSKFHNEIDDRT